MSSSPSNRLVIVPQGESHFEVRYFENEEDGRFRSWRLPLAAAEAVTRWWLRQSLPLEEVTTSGEGSVETEMKAGPPSSAILKEVREKADILARYQGTPIGDWLHYQGLGDGLSTYDSPQMLIVTCMDYRISLHVPRNFAYILRLAGANLRHREFDLACVLAWSGIRHISLIGHTDCAMESLIGKRVKFASGLERAAGWTKTRADLQFDLCAPRLHIPNVIDFILFQGAWLERRYPGILVAPLIYDVNDGVLHQIVRQP